MVTLYVDGRPVGTLADAAKLIPEFIAKNIRVEFRDAAGNSVGTFNPTPLLPHPLPGTTISAPEPFHSTVRNYIIMYKNSPCVPQLSENATSGTK